MNGKIAETTSGKIQGTTEQGVLAFKVIPYGGRMGVVYHWIPPAQPRFWAGIHDTTNYANMRTQIGMDLKPKDVPGFYPRDLPKCDHCPLHQWFGYLSLPNLLDGYATVHDVAEEL